MIIVPILVWYLDLKKKASNFVIDPKGKNSMITRALESTIRNKLCQNKAIIIIGVGQVGKTTLLKQMCSSSNSASSSSFKIKKLILQEKAGLTITNAKTSLKILNISCSGASGSRALCKLTIKSGCSPNTFL